MDPCQNRKCKSLFERKFEALYIDGSDVGQLLASSSAPIPPVETWDHCGHTKCFVKDRRNMPQQVPAVYIHNVDNIPLLMLEKYNCVELKY